MLKPMLYYIMIIALKYKEKSPERDMRLSIIKNSYNSISKSSHIFKIVRILGFLLVSNLILFKVDCVIPQIVQSLFCMFFVFSGNMARIPQIQEIIFKTINNNTLLAGIISCQFISNVLSAIFLSKFTSNYTDLVAAVNLGSLGIMISSLASLITLKEYLKQEQGKTLRYIGLFTVINTIFFVILLLVYTII